MRQYIDRYGYIDSDNEDKINTVIREQTNVINNCNDRIERLKNSWLQTTTDSTWRNSSFAMNERNSMDRASNSIKKAQAILQQIEILKK